ncbi:hypothetical protein ABWED_3295 (plasmid) [Acinetobacter lwoffii]|uniref:Uncharacterized protein n=1 Tax=Aeromonas salmonicida subsp. salmonicida TaxID=29491 RepID=A0A096Y6P7_AERSS|nr:hypothetical protein [Aeromonas salmonicida subsp. salmonicida]EXS20171.1 hypothetical protein J658_4122 [Acinetobacter baumannii 573719]UVB02434.1 hypothetical protein ABWED_3295 [Acinetobacter lwoffii]
MSVDSLYDLNQYIQMRKKSNKAKISAFILFWIIGFIY